MTLGVHRGTDVRCGRASGVGISRGSAGFTGLSAGITATSALIFSGRAGGSQRIVTRTSTVTRAVTTRLSAIRATIRPGIARRCYLL